MSMLTSFCFVGIPVALLFWDLSSPNGFLFGLTAKKLVNQHRLFGVNCSQMQMLYQAWIGLVFLATLLTWGIANSTIFAGLFLFSGIWGGLIYLQASVNRRLIQFDTEFLRFIQMLKSDYHLQSSLTSLIPSTIEKISKNQTDQSKKRSCLHHFLKWVAVAIDGNQDHVDAFRDARKKWIEGSGLQIKLMNLFIGFISSIHDSGAAGRAFDSLERRIESDLAIGHELRAVTSGAKMQMIILTLVPPAVMIFFSFSMGEMVVEMLQSTLGQGLITGAAFMTITAVWVTQKILNVKV